MSAALGRSSILAVAAALLLGGASQVLAADSIATSIETATADTAAVVEHDSRARAPMTMVPPATLTNQNTALRDSILTVARRASYISFAATQVLDAHWTLIALQNNGREINPLMKAASGSPAKLYAVKAATVGATIFFAERLGKKSPVKTLIVMAVLNAGYGLVVAHNYRVAQRLIH